MRRETEIEEKKEIKNSQKYQKVALKGNFILKAKKLYFQYHSVEGNYGFYFSRQISKRVY